MIEITSRNYPLSSLELEILHSVPNGGELKPYAYALYIGREGLEMGPVRMARETTDGKRVYSISPFPGAWNDDVPEADIVRVRHLQAFGVKAEDLT